MVEVSLSRFSEKPNYKIQPGNWVLVRPHTPEKITASDHGLAAIANNKNQITTKSVKEYIEQNHKKLSSKQKQLIFNRYLTRLNTHSKAGLSRKLSADTWELRPNFISRLESAPNVFQKPHTWLTLLSSFCLEKQVTLEGPSMFEEHKSKLAPILSTAPHCSLSKALHETYKDRNTFLTSKGFRPPPLSFPESKTNSFVRALKDSYLKKVAKEFEAGGLRFNPVPKNGTYKTKVRKTIWLGANKYAIYQVNDWITIQPALSQSIKNKTLTVSFHNSEVTEVSTLNLKQKAHR